MLQRLFINHCSQFVFVGWFVGGRADGEDVVVRFVFGRIYYRIKMKFICEVSQHTGEENFLRR